MKKEGRGKSKLECKEGNKKRLKGEDIPRSCKEKKESSKGKKEKDEISREKKKNIEAIKFDEATCSLVIKGSLTLKDIKEAFKNFKSIENGKGHFILKYPSKEHALVDMKANRKQGKEKKESSGRYLDNKYILTNLSYKENEESISKVFEKYGEIERIRIKKNKDNISTGKAIITFKKKAVIKEEIVMNNKPVYIERMKKPWENKTRFFLGKLNKAHSIVEIRKILADVECKPKEIRVIYGENKRNRGYGFIEYANEEDANAFTEKFEEIKDRLGAGCYYEYSNEKASSRRR
ncbi:RNA-binding domain-containing protein [Encephalitozoon intestinalis]